MEISEARIRPEVPSRRSFPNLDLPPVPSRWDICVHHSNNKYTAICVTCMKFLCQKCLMSEIYYHQQCDITYLYDDVLPACQKLHSTLAHKMNNLGKTISEFHDALTRKRERMLRKRDHTMGEIERFFTKLREKMLSKLRSDETALLNVMEAKVNEQDKMIREKIDQCNCALSSMADKRVMLQNVEQLCRSGRGGSSVSYLKNLVQTSDEINSYEQSGKEAAAARDAFLVIRFFVDSETEQALLNSHIACLEVLSSLADDPNVDTLESAGICEAENDREASQVPTGVEVTSRNSKSDDATENVHAEKSHLKNPGAQWNADNVELRVDLPVTDKVETGRRVHFREKTSGRDPEKKPGRQSESQSISRQDRRRDDISTVIRDTKQHQRVRPDVAPRRHSLDLPRISTRQSSDVYTQANEENSPVLEESILNSDIPSQELQGNSGLAQPTHEHRHEPEETSAQSTNNASLCTEREQTILNENQNELLTDESVSFSFADELDEGYNIGQTDVDHRRAVNADNECASQVTERCQPESVILEQTSECAASQPSESVSNTSADELMHDTEGAQACIVTITRTTSEAESNNTHSKRHLIDRSMSADDIMRSSRSNENAVNSGEETMHEDDPPPPYPGLPSSPTPPGPNELPPPYSTGPPPPYSINILPHHLLDTAATAAGNFPRSSSDTELQSRVAEIAAPTQTTTPRLSHPKLKKAFSVNEASDRRVSGIFSLATVRGANFLIVDRWNKKLKYYSSVGHSFGGLIFREEPWDIAEVTDDLVAVTVPKLNTLYKIRVTEDAVVTIGSVKTLRSYACIAYNMNTEYFICGQVPQFGEPLIDVIGIDGGSVIQSFRGDMCHPMLRFSYPRYVKINEEGTVIVCDWNLKCLVVFKLDGTVIGRYRGTVEFPLTEPTGITYHPVTREIYVIDAKHNSTHGAVHIVTMDCRCKEIIRWDNEFRVARVVAPYDTGYVLGNKSGVMSVFTASSRRRR